ncbi:MAG: hypothetical protein ACTSSD_19875 [Candidatus Thorarchaeota archaeon]
MMNSDDDMFFEDEDAEEDATFPDEDIEDEDIEEEVEEYIEEVKEVRTYDDDSTSGFAKFMADPWPPTAFIITLIGLGLVLLTPSTIWNPNRYGIIGVFALLGASLVGIVFSLITWQRAGTHRLKWAGPVNIMVILVAAGIGVVDTFSWILFTTGMIPGLDQPLILLCFMLVFFSLYMLWMIQRSLDPEPR